MILRIGDTVSVSWGRRAGQFGVIKYISEAPAREAWCYIEFAEDDAYWVKEGDLRYV